MKATLVLPASRPQRAFTLLELAIALAIMAVLAALGGAVYRNVVHHSRTAACLSHLRQLGVGLNLYLSDHNMVMPSLVGERRSKGDDQSAVDTVLAAYVPDTRLFACPEDNRNLAALTGTNYRWNYFLNGQSAGSLHWSRAHTAMAVPILMDKRFFHPTEQINMNFLYADGHVTNGFRMFTSE